MTLNQALSLVKIPAADYPDFDIYHNDKKYTHSIVFSVAAPTHCPTCAV